VSTLKAILVEVEPARTSELRELLAAAGCELTACVPDTGEVPTAMSRLGADLVVLSVTAPEDRLLESLVAVQGSSPTPVVLFAADERADTIRRAVQAGVSAYVTDGVEQHRVRAILEAAIARFRQFKALAEELARTRGQLAERKRIERAKGIVMAQRGLTEEQAYKLMRKTAMDRNRRLAEIADSIIAASEVLGEPGRTSQHMPAGAV